MQLRLVRIVEITCGQGDASMVLLVNSITHQMFKVAEVSRPQLILLSPCFQFE
jgi:hypothetical protein